MQIGAQTLSFIIHFSRVRTEGVVLHRRSTTAFFPQLIQLTNQHYISRQECQTRQQGLVYLVKIQCYKEEIDRGLKRFLLEKTHTHTKKKKKTRRRKDSLTLTATKTEFSGGRNEPWPFCLNELVSTKRNSK